MRDAIQRLAVGHRFYGYRRITILVQREGYEVGTRKYAVDEGRQSAGGTEEGSLLPPPIPTMTLWCIRIWRSS